MMRDDNLYDELIERLVDRYTAPELIDLLDMSIEDLISYLPEDVLMNQIVLRELGFSN